MRIRGRLRGLRDRLDPRSIRRGDPRPGPQGRPARLAQPSRSTTGSTSTFDLAPQSTPHARKVIDGVLATLGFEPLARAAAPRPRSDSRDGRAGRLPAGSRAAGRVYCRVLACDFDGTGASDGHLAPQVADACASPAGKASPHCSPPAARSRICTSRWPTSRISLGTDGAARRSPCRWCRATCWSAVPRTDRAHRRPGSRDERLENVRARYALCGRGCDRAPCPAPAFMPATAGGRRAPRPPAAPRRAWPSSRHRRGGARSRPPPASWSASRARRAAGQRAQRRGRHRDRVVAERPEQVLPRHAATRRACATSQGTAREIVAEDRRRRRSGAPDRSRRRRRCRGRPRPAPARR